ncbi:hypothetical protein A1F96_10575 [Pyrenophora tritici-repentis]|nr:hypothetical protein PtrSN001A_011749 [Pyrenophora tritici-repentis]KAI1564236.1 hypothetical protein PtrEW4_008946 [Pyrenophora tritici-repentis]PWO22789.1 PPR-2 domain containing protein [Pyrenophora tritici-repentis]PZC89176.1 hypothetical protein A1F95_10485 [Pyrenophora tritici-repentis]PZD23074.1 hypothetical protein A1F96_10575 [Pyrenophora tritici-repentis]
MVFQSFTQLGVEILKQATQGVSIFGQLDQESTRTFINNRIGNALNKQGPPTDHLDDIRHVVGSTIAKATSPFESSATVAPLSGYGIASPVITSAGIHENRANRRSTGPSAGQITLGHEASAQTLQDHIAYGTYPSQGPDAIETIEASIPLVSKKPKDGTLPPPRPISRASKMIPEAESISRKNVEEAEEWTLLDIEDDDTPVRSTIEYTALSLGATAMDELRLSHKNTYIKTAMTEFDLFEARKIYNTYKSTLAGVGSENCTSTQRTELNRL